MTISGAVAGWQLLLDAHGTKGFDELLIPAARCAEEGFPVHQRVAWDWSMYEDKLRRAGNALFLPGGRAPHEGDRFVQTALAGTLRAIAKRGADAFYTGPVAADMAATLKAAIETKVLAGSRGHYRLTREVQKVQVPATVQAVLAARIDRLPHEAKRLLQARAVIGKDVSLALLQDIADLSEEARAATWPCSRPASFCTRSACSRAWSTRSATR